MILYVLLIMIACLTLGAIYFRNDLIKWFKNHWKQFIVLVTGGLIITGGGGLLLNDEIPIGNSSPTIEAIWPDNGDTFTIDDGTIIPIIVVGEDLDDDDLSIGVRIDSGTWSWQHNINSGECALFEYSINVNDDTSYTLDVRINDDGDTSADDSDSGNTIYTYDESSYRTWTSWNAYTQGDFTHNPSYAIDGNINTYARTDNFAWVDGEQTELYYYAKNSGGGNLDIVNTRWAMWDPGLAGRLDDIDYRLLVDGGEVDSALNMDEGDIPQGDDGNYWDWNNYFGGKDFFTIDEVKIECDYRDALGGSDTSPSIYEMQYMAANPVETPQLIYPPNSGSVSPKCVGLSVSIDDYDGLGNNGEAERLDWYVYAEKNDATPDTLCASGTSDQLKTIVYYNLYNLDEDSTYYWKVKVIDEFGNEETSSIFSFTTESKPDVWNHDPVDEETGVSTSPTISVSVIDDDGDEVDVTFKDGSGSTIGTDSIGSSGGTASTTYSSASEPETTYYWYVEAEDNDGKTTTPTYEFTTAGNSAPTASNPDPSDGSLSCSTSVTYDIDVSDTEGDNIDVKFYKSDNTLISTHTGETSGSTVTSSSVSYSAGDSADWYVEIQDSHNSYTKWPTTGYYELDINEAPSSPTDNYPINGTEITDNQITLSVTPQDSDGSLDSLDVDFYGSLSSGTPALLGSDNGVNSGESATYTWTSLNNNDDYIWYTVTEDSCSETYNENTNSIEYDFSTNVTVEPPPNNPPLLTSFELIDEGNTGWDLDNNNFTCSWEIDDLDGDMLTMLFNFGIGSEPSDPTNTSYHAIVENAQDSVTNKDVTITNNVVNWDDTSSTVYVKCRVFDGENYSGDVSSGVIEIEISEGYTGYSNDEWGTYDTYPIAQTFEIPKNYTVTDVYFYGEKIGSPGNVEVTIQEHDATPPTGSYLTSGTILQADISTSVSWNKVSVTEYELDSTKSYWVQFNVTGGDSNNYVDFGINTDSQYPDGDFVRYISSWTAITYQDMLFNVTGYYEGNASEEMIYFNSTDEFDSGYWDTYESNSYGRNELSSTLSHTGTYSWRMDSTTAGNYALNELITSYNFSGATNINLTFWQRDTGDEETDAPSSWTGHDNSDAVSFTNDGTTWYEIVTASQLNNAAWEEFNINISNDPDFSSPASDNFAIKFQQYDNFPYQSDGRFWDDISIHHNSPISTIISEFTNGIDGTNPTFGSFSSDADIDSSGNGIDPDSGYYDDSSYQGDFSGCSDSTAGIDYYQIKYNGGSYGSPDSNGLNVPCSITSGDNDIYYKIQDEAGNYIEGDTTENVYYGSTSPSGGLYNVIGEINGWPNEHYAYCESPNDLTSGTMYINTGGLSNWGLIVDDSSVSWGSGGYWKVRFPGAWGGLQFDDLVSPYQTSNNYYSTNTGSTSSVDLEIVNKCGLSETLTLDTTSDTSVDEITNLDARPDSYTDEPHTYDDDTLMYFTWDEITDTGAGVYKYYSEFNTNPPTEESESSTQDKDIGIINSDNYFYIMTVDYVGNTNTASKIVWMDNIDPTLIIHQVENNSIGPSEVNGTFSDSLSVGGSVPDLYLKNTTDNTYYNGSTWLGDATILNLSFVQWNEGGVSYTWKIYPDEFPSNFLPGEYLVYGTGYDSAGNSDDDSMAFTVTSSANMSVDAPYTIYCNNVSLQATNESEVDNITLYWRESEDNSTGWSSWTEWDDPSNPDETWPFTWDFTFPDGAGYYEFYVRSTTNGIMSPIPDNAQVIHENVLSTTSIDSINSPTGPMSPPIIIQDQTWAVLNVTVNSNCPYDTIDVEFINKDDYSTIDTVTDVNPGGYAQTNWSGLNYNYVYNWYVNVTSDSGEVTQMDNTTFILNDIPELTNFRIETINSDNAYLEWDNPEDILWFQITISNENSWVSKMSNDSGNITVDDLLPSTVYNAEWSAGDNLNGIADYYDFNFSTYGWNTDYYDYGYKRLISISPDTISSDLEGYAYTFSLTEENFNVQDNWWDPITPSFTKMQSDLDDIRFTDYYDTTNLDFEIESSSVPGDGGISEDITEDESGYIGTFVNPSYAWDGDWNTKTSADTDGILYINYTKPASVLTDDYDNEFHIYAGTDIYLGLLNQYVSGSEVRLKAEMNYTQSYIDLKLYNWSSSSYENFDYYDSDSGSTESSNVSSRYFYDTSITWAYDCEVELSVVPLHFNDDTQELGEGIDANYTTKMWMYYGNSDATNSETILSPSGYETTAEATIGDEIDKFLPNPVISDLTATVDGDVTVTWNNNINCNNYLYYSENPWNADATLWNYSASKNEAFEDKIGNKIHVNRLYAHGDELETYTVDCSNSSFDVESTYWIIDDSSVDDNAYFNVSNCDTTELLTWWVNYTYNKSEVRSSASPEYVMSGLDSHKTYYIQAKAVSVLNESRNDTDDSSFVIDGLNPAPVASIISYTEDRPNETVTLTYEVTDMNAQVSIDVSVQYINGDDDILYESSPVTRSSTGTYTQDISVSYDHEYEYRLKIEGSNTNYSEIYSNWFMPIGPFFAGNYIEDDDNNGNLTNVRHRQYLPTNESGNVQLNNYGYEQYGYWEGSEQDEDWMWVETNITSNTPLTIHLYKKDGTHVGDYTMTNDGDSDMQYKNLTGLGQDWYTFYITDSTSSVVLNWTKPGPYHRMGESRIDESKYVKFGGTKTTDDMDYRLMYLDWFYYNTSAYRYVINEGYDLYEAMSVTYWGQEGTGIPEEDQGTKYDRGQLFRGGVTNGENQDSGMISDERLIYPLGSFDGIYNNPGMDDNPQRHCFSFTAYWFNESALFDDEIENWYFRFWEQDSWYSTYLGRGQTALWGGAHLFTWQPDSAGDTRDWAMYDGSQIGEYTGIPTDEYTLDSTDYTRQTTSNTTFNSTYDQHLMVGHRNLSVPLKLYTDQAYNLGVAFDGRWPNQQIGEHQQAYVIFNLPDNSTLQGMDSDSDGLNDYEEIFTYYTNPKCNDTDEDGFNDGDEINYSTDPNLYTSINEPPSLNLQLPSNNSMIYDLDSVTLQWDCVDITGSEYLDYDIYYEKDDSNPNYVTNTSDLYYEITSLDYDSTYYWYIVATDGLETNTSQIWNFTTRERQVPSPPSSFSIIDENISRLTLRWTKGQYADYTYIEYKESDTTWSRGDGTELCNITGIEYDHDNLESDNIYYYQAWSWNDIDDVWSTTYSTLSGTTEVDDPPVTYNTNPANGSIADSSSLEWTCDVYDQYSDIDWTLECNGNSDSGTTTSGSQISLTITGIEVGETYTLYVNITDGNSYTREWYIINTRDLYTPTVYSFSSNTFNKSTINIGTSVDDNTDWYILENNSISDWNLGEGNELANSSSFYTHSNLEQNTMYYYKVFAYNKTDNIYTNETDNSITDSNEPPYANGENPNNNSYVYTDTVNWIININDEDDTEITWSIECGEYLNDSTLSGDSTAGYKQLTIENLQQGQEYTVYVNVSDDYNTVNYWYKFTRYTEDIPYPPSGLYVDSYNYTCINVTWSLGAKSDMTRIEYNTDSDWDRGDGSFAYWGSGTNTDIYNLQEGTTYYIQGWSYNNSGFYSTSSIKINQKTLGDNVQNIYNPNPNDNEVDISIDLSQVSINLYDSEGTEFDWWIKGDFITNTQGTIYDSSYYTKTANVISQLDYGTEYSWTVETHDSKDKWLNKTYSFITEYPGYVTIQGSNPSNESINQDTSLTFGVYMSSSESFEWWLECSNGDTVHSSSDTSGTKTLSISGLNYNTQYTVWANATVDGNYTRKWYTFTTIGESIPDFSVSNNPVYDSTIYFTDESTGTIYNYWWTFDNGETSMNANPTTTYNYPGVYTVTLNVNDNTSSQSYDINVGSMITTRNDLDYFVWLGDNVTLQQVGGTLSATSLEYYDGTGWGSEGTHVINTYEVLKSNEIINHRCVPNEDINYASSITISIPSGYTYICWRDDTSTDLESITETNIGFTSHTSSVSLWMPSYYWKPWFPTITPSSENEDVYRYYVLEAFNSGSTKSYES